MFLFEILVNNNRHFTFIMTAESSFSQTNPINMNTLCFHQQRKERETTRTNSCGSEEEHAPEEEQSEF